MTDHSSSVTIKNVVAAGKGTVPSAARRLQRSEARELGETARALPDGWVVAIEAPYGQLAILPAPHVRHSVGCWVADKATSSCRRIAWRPAL
jgi:hypothetical protein